MANVKSAILLSGGMDSIAVAHWVRPDVAITIDYGQTPAQAELRASEAAAKAIGIDLYPIRIDLSSLGSGDLVGTSPLPIAPVREWWPFRNQMLVTIAAMKAITLSVDRLVIGTVKSDAFHADGRPEFIDAISGILRQQEGGIALEAPAIGLTPVETVRKSNVPMDILAWAHSCHVSDYACGYCRGCRKHYETMRELGVDPY